MPLVPSATEKPGPDVAHLALLVDDAGMRLAIPPGASLWLVEDKNRADKIFPLVLKKVSHKALTFEMRAADGSVSEYVYKLVVGRPLSRHAHQRMLKNRQGP